MYDLIGKIKLICLWRKLLRGLGSNRVKVYWFVFGGICRGRWDLEIFFC